MDDAEAAAIRKSVGERRILLKVARWDPDKRWLLSLEALAGLKVRGRQTMLLARGGVEAHGGEVMQRAHELGLRVRNVAVAPKVSDYAAALSASAAEGADVMNVMTSIPHEVLRVLYRAADGVMVNSGREPFGLVGLESMAAGGATYTGNTGEEYVRHLQNAIAFLAARSRDPGA